LRIIEGVFVCRWDSGDTEYMWNPGLGYVFRRGVPPTSDMDSPLGAGPGPDAGVPDHGVDLPPDFRDLAISNRLKPILTLAPYEGYLPDVAQRIAAQTGYPLVTLSPDGLRFRDMDHLNAVGRDMASERLAEGVLKIISTPSTASARH
jgi:hypothetical protein